MGHLEQERHLAQVPFGKKISKDPTKRFDFEMHSFHSGTKPNHYYGTITFKKGKIYYKMKLLLIH